jgi:hypothetical protein
MPAPSQHGPTRQHDPAQCDTLPTAVRCPPAWRCVSHLSHYLTLTVAAAEHGAEQGRARFGQYKHGLRRIRRRRPGPPVFVLRGSRRLRFAGPRGCITRDLVWAHSAITGANSLPCPCRFTHRLVLPNPAVSPAQFSHPPDSHPPRPPDPACCTCQDARTGPASTGDHRPGAPGSLGLRGCRAVPGRVSTGGRGCEVTTCML